MRWLVHWNKKTRVVRGGRTMEETCPECGETAVFREVEETEAIGVFFALDLASSTDRAWQCTACEEVFDLKEPKTPAPPPKPRVDPEVDRRRRDEEQRRRDQQVEDELAALKRRLGR